MTMKQAVDKTVEKWKAEFASHNSTFTLHEWLTLNKPSMAEDARNIYLLNHPDDGFFKFRHHTEKTLGRLQQLRQNAMKYLIAF